MVCKKCREDKQPLCLCGFCKDCIQKYGHDNLGREFYNKEQGSLTIGGIEANKK